MWKYVLSLIAIALAGTSLTYADETSIPATSVPQYSPSSVPAAGSGLTGGYVPYSSRSYNVDTGTPSSAIANAPAPADGGCGGGCPAQCCLHGWFGADYLMLFPTPITSPVLLRAPAAANVGVPLIGTAPAPGINSGVRIDSGLWLCEDKLALQGVFWTTFRTYVNLTQPAGTIPLTGQIGPVGVTNFDYQTWNTISSAEGNTLLRLRGGCETKLYGLLGTRFLQIEEDLSMLYSAAGGNFYDQFHTRNVFAGGQFGLMLTHCHGRLLFDLTSKLAVGNNYTQLYVIGSNTAGIAFQAFTGASNIGGPNGRAAGPHNYESNYLVVMPEINANVGYRLTDRLSAHVGYNFLYLYNTWRPGDQISLANDGGVTQPAINPAVKANYFLHGMNAGATFRF